MAGLPSTGPISFRDVNEELLRSPTATLSLNDADVRNLFERLTGAISLADGRGKKFLLVTGGVVFDEGGFRYHRFNTSGTLTVQGSGEFDYLIVAGGGAGGQRSGGGGGAGGVLNGTKTVTTGTYNIIIGAGGASVQTFDPAQRNGNNSSALNLTAVAGGGGGGPKLYTTGVGEFSHHGQNGGSGGAGGPGNPAVHGDGIPGQGHGGAGTNQGTTPANVLAGGGGGGAGEPGFPNFTQFAPIEDGTIFGYLMGGNGGNGRIWPPGSNTRYGGGGGGGAGIRTTGGRSYTGTVGQGGDGGGGAGGRGRASEASFFGSDEIPPSPGAVNTGGGGGAMGASGSSVNFPAINLGGSGGSGVVIIRYPL